jgi:hypothetical protein
MQAWQCKCNLKIEKENQKWTKWSTWPTTQTFYPPPKLIHALSSVHEPIDVKVKERENRYNLRDSWCRSVVESASGMSLLAGRFVVSCTEKMNLKNWRSNRIRCDWCRRRDTRRRGPETARNRASKWLGSCKRQREVSRDSNCLWNRWPEGPADRTSEGANRTSLGWAALGSSWFGGWTSCVPQARARGPQEGDRALNLRCLASEVRRLLCSAA